MVELAFTTTVYSGTVFDVSPSGNTYSPGGKYNIFAGKDGSKALGISSVKAEDAVADYSGLNADQLKVLDGWYNFFVQVGLHIGLGSCKL